MDDATASLAQRARAQSLRMFEGLVSRASTIALAHTDESVADAHFAAALSVRRCHRRGRARAFAVLPGTSPGVCAGDATLRTVGLAFLLVAS